MLFAFKSYIYILSLFLSLSHTHTHTTHTHTTHTHTQLHLIHTRGRRTSSEARAAVLSHAMSMSRLNTNIGSDDADDMNDSKKYSEFLTQFQVSAIVDINLDFFC